MKSWGERTKRASLNGMVKKELGEDQHKSEPNLSHSTPTSPSICSTPMKYKHSKYMSRTVYELEAEMKDMVEEINHRKEIAISKVRLRLNMASTNYAEIANEMNVQADTLKYSSEDVERIFAVPIGWPVDAIMHMEIAAEIIYNRNFANILLDSPPKEIKKPEEQKKNRNCTPGIFG